MGFLCTVKNYCFEGVIFSYAKLKLSLFCTICTVVQDGQMSVCVRYIFVTFREAMVCDFADAYHYQRGPMGR